MTLQAFAQGIAMATDRAKNGISASLYLDGDQLLVMQLGAAPERYRLIAIVMPNGDVDLYHGLKDVEVLS